MKEAQTLKYHRYFDEVVSCDKGWNSLQVGRFQKNWSREISTYLVLAGSDKEKGLNFGEEASCIVLNCPCLLQIIHNKRFL